MTEEITTQIATAKSTATEQARLQQEAGTRAAAARRQLEELQASIEQDERAATEAARAADHAQKEAAHAERLIPPAPASAKVARSQAARLLSALDPPADADTERPAPAEQWDAIDDVRARLLTAEIADDARPVVVACEAVIAACDDWERSRANGLNIVGDSPSSSRVVQRILAELRNVLDGTSPTDGAPEGIGELLGTGVAPSQIAKMCGCVSADGSADLPTLGAIIDRGLAAAGFDTVAAWTNTRHLAAISVDDAWASRQATVETRRGQLAALSGRRPGRRPDRDGCRPANSAKPKDPWELSPEEEAVHRHVRFGDFAGQRMNSPHPLHGLG